jgi:hypothetical protein
MNERVEHCLYESGLTAQGCWDELDDYAKQGIEKFAELLEKEFFSQGYIAGRSDGTIETVRECADFLADTLDDHFASEQVREHFGVES